MRQVGIDVLVYVEIENVVVKSLGRHFARRALRKYARYEKRSDCTSERNGKKRTPSYLAAFEEVLSLCDRRKKCLLRVSRGAEAALSCSHPWLLLGSAGRELSAIVNWNNSAPPTSGVKQASKTHNRVSLSRLLQSARVLADTIFDFVVFAIGFVSMF